MLNASGAARYVRQRHAEVSLIKARPSTTLAAAQGDFDFVTMNIGAGGYEKDLSKTVMHDLKRVASTFNYQGTL